MTAPVQVGPSSQHGGPDPSPALHLYPQHLELLRLAANGYSSREIADELILSPHTVNDYWREIYRRLGAKNRENAVAMAIVRGLIRPDEVELRAPRWQYESNRPGLTARRSARPATTDSKKRTS
ncbi:LuxR C-terminal-related transcriptional regulator [Streptomyces sp. NPDC029006]|uniref:response regulator transcription factor n=1 Tax=Streptomyces sp. NPDC029006 TaxID=3155467 RepID=UPI0033FDA1C5